MRQLVPVCCLLLSGCLGTAGPDYRPPELETPASFSRVPSLPQGAAQSALWWRGFGDVQMAILVEDALAENLDIAAAQARLEEARALLGVARGSGGPSLDGGANADGDLLVAGERSGGRDTRATGGVDGGLLFSWTPDLFGGQRREVEAAEAELRRRGLLREDLQRTTAAEVVRQYLEVARDTTRLELIASSLDLQRQTLELVRQRFEAGLAAQLDVSRAQAQLAATQAQRGPLAGDLADARAALAVLTGRPAGTLQVGADDGIPSYLGGPDIGLPRNLLRARPDVRAAEADLARATAEIGVAEAELYPQLTIPGALTASASGFGTGEVIEALIATLSASLDIPLFDSGVRDSEVAAAEARAREALLIYRRTLLDALADAETAIARLEAAEQRRDDLQAAVDASQEAFAQAEQLYTQGLVGFLDVLDAERTLLDNRQDLAEATADVGLAIADLYSAVGAPVSPPEQGAN
jgi:multidrug efflux system outer membrane protein